MRRALVGCLALALGCEPIGTILVIRRMNLMSDALSHAVLPGAALGFLIAGLSLLLMRFGGVVAGLVVALLSGLVIRPTPLREDTSFADFYPISLALGVLLVSIHGSNVDLLRLLFGSILAVDDAALILIGGISPASLLALAVIYRPLVVECFDRVFLRAVSGRGGLVHGLFLALVVFNMVAGFQALGTLMAVGLIIAACRRRALLGARVVVSERGAHCVGAWLGLSRPAVVLSPPPALRAGDHPGRRARLSRLRGFRPARQPARALCSARAS